MQISPDFESVPAHGTFFRGRVVLRIQKRSFHASRILSWARAAVLLFADIGCDHCEGSLACLIITRLRGPFFGALLLTITTTTLTTLVLVISDGDPTQRFAGRGHVSYIHYAIFLASSHPLNHRTDDLKRLRGVYSLTPPSALLCIVIMLQSTSAPS
jgi:hypothetical protein